MTATQVPEMTVPATDLAAQWREIQDEVEPKLLDLMRRGDYLGAAEVAAFEAEWAAYVGAPHAVACSSGTDAVELMVRACTDGYKPLVEVPRRTFVATLAAVERSGVDYTLERSDRADARIAVWLYGSTQGADVIQRECAERGVMLLEDASQAHGNPRAGKVGVAAAWSLYPSKNLGGIAQGGIVTFKHRVHAERARLIREHGYDRATDTHVMRGFNMRLDGGNAVALRAKLKRLDKWVARKREIAAQYLAAFKDERAIRCDNHVDWVPEPDHCYHQFVVTIVRSYSTNNGMGYIEYHDSGTSRDAVLAFLRSHGIGAMVHYRTTADGREDDWSRSCLSLPVHPHLTDGQVAYVIEHVKRAVRGE